MTNIFSRWIKERPLKAVWEVKKGKRKAILVGTAHFFPFSFKKAMTKLIEKADIVLFEGPLDEASMLRVVEYGREKGHSPSLIDALDPQVINAINKQLGPRLSPPRGGDSYMQLLHPSPQNYLEVHTKGVRHWLAFFTIWSAFLNWRYSMDTEGFQIAQKLDKRIHFLETIEEQLAALDGIPFDRIVQYVNHMEYWNAHKELFLIAFLKGELEKFSSLTGEFPTRCESIIDRRDPLFFDRMKPYFNEGLTVAFIGVAHVPGIRKRLLDEGYEVTQKTI